MVHTWASLSWFCKFKQVIHEGKDHVWPFYLNMYHHAWYMTDKYSKYFSGRMSSRKSRHPVWLLHLASWQSNITSPFSLPLLSQNCCGSKCKVKGLVKPWAFLYHLKQSIWYLICGNSVSQSQTTAATNCSNEVQTECEAKNTCNHPGIREKVQLERWKWGYTSCIPALSHSTKTSYTNFRDKQMIYKQN